MSTWDRIQRLELELVQAHARIRHLEESRELARSAASHAIQTCAICSGEIVEVRVIP